MAEENKVAEATEQEAQQFEFQIQRIYVKMFLLKHLTYQISLTKSGHQN